MMKLKRFLILKLFGKYLDDSDETLFSENTRADAVREIYGGKNPQSRRAMLEIMKINKLKKLIAKCIVNIVGYPNDNIIKYLS